MKKPMATRDNELGIDIERWLGNAMLFGSGALFVLMIDLLMFGVGT